MDLGDGRVAVEELDLLAVLGGLIDPGAKLLDLPWLVSERQRAGLLEIAVDAVRSGERDEALEVVDALALESVELVGEVTDPVRQAVGEARLAEATVAAAGAGSHRSHLEHHDPERRVRVGQRDRRPEAREAGTDDHHVCGELLPVVEGRIGDALRSGLAKPVGDGLVVRHRRILPRLGTAGRRPRATLTRVIRTRMTRPRRISL
jgi:hypothetical protein